MKFDKKNKPFQGFQRFFFYSTVKRPEAEGVYILNRKKIAGVMLTQKQYESLNKETDRLHDLIAELIAEKRLLDKNAAVFSDIEVRGAIANKEPVIDEADGWE